MKLKEKIKSYSFWVSIASAIILILKVLGSRFGFTIDESMASDLFTALCSVLVLLGIIVVPNPQNAQTAQKQDTNEKKVVNEKPELDGNIVLADSLDKAQYTENEQTFVQDETTKAIDDQQSDIKEPDFEQPDNLVDDTQIETVSEIQNISETTTEDTGITNEIPCENIEVVSDNNTDSVNNTETTNLTSLFEKQRENFSGDLNEYIFLLQEEIKNIREKM